MKKRSTEMIICFLTVLSVAATYNNAFALNAPELTISTSGMEVSLSWTPVTGATEYTLHYTPYPYDGEQTIIGAGMGTATAFSTTLWNGAAYYVAITASNGTIDSTYSNIGLFIINKVNPNGDYPVVGTNQTKYYNNVGEITAPAPGQPYYGQAAFHPGNIPSYTDNGDGTITDNVTGLMWVKSRGSKITWSDAVAGASTNTTAGYSDWRMPTIKELYSLILFSGVNGPDNTKIDGYIPYIDTSYFEFIYGPGSSTNIGDRIIDCQDWSANEYVSTVMGDQSAIFGVNFADGRIKGYNQFIPFSGAGNENYVRYVRGNSDYGENNFKDNGDNTVTDLATNLMWSKDDSQIGLDWPEALAWVQAQNAVYYLGYKDWRLPDAKELQSIVDYTRSPSKTNSPAIDANFFNTTTITDEAGQNDYPYFWTGSVLLEGGPFPSGIYISFGRAMGYMNNSWIDVHGAGSQKSDIMVGDPTDYPNGRGPQGDAVRIYNYVRLVRDIE